MKIYGLSGKSGTGKSYNATELCGKMNIEGIIDDGLFIAGNNIIAGESAKKQETKIGAVKTAMFMKEAHCDGVKKAIKNVNPSSILILGTSDRMVEEIAERLELPKPCKIIHIEDITTQAQRDRAAQERGGAGTHVIPAPTFQLRRQFSGYFLDPKRGLKNAGFQKNIHTEKTVVRPTFSYMGHYEISDKVITDIAHHMAQMTPGVAGITWMSSKNSEEGMYIRIIAQFEYGSKVKTAALALQRAVYDSVEYMTAFNVLGVEVEIRGFKFK